MDGIKHWDPEDGKQASYHGTTDPCIARKRDIQMIKHKRTVAPDQCPCQIEQRRSHSISVRARNVRHHCQGEDVQYKMPHPKQGQRIRPSLTHSFVRRTIKSDDGRKRNEHKPQSCLGKRLQHFTLDPFCDHETTQRKSGVLHWYTYQ